MQEQQRFIVPADAVEAVQQCKPSLCIKIDSVCVAVVDEVKVQMELWKKQSTYSSS